MKPYTCTQKPYTDDCYKNANSVKKQYSGTPLVRPPLLQQKCGL